MNSKLVQRLKSKPVILTALAVACVAVDVGLALLAVSQWHLIEAALPWLAGIGFGVLLGSRARSVFRAMREATIERAGAALDRP